MKKYFIILSLLSTVCLFSQSKVDTIQPILQPVKFDINLNTNKHFFTFNQLSFYTKNDFSIYNRTTMMNDNFSVHNGQFEYKNSILIPENMVFNSKIDSNKILSKNSLESYNNHFDCVVSSMVFHHIMNLDEALDDVYRIMKVDGKLLVVDLDLDDGSFHRDELDFKGHNGFERNQFKSLVESHGFACIELETALRDNKRSDDKELQYSLFYLYAKKVDRI